MQDRFVQAIRYKLQKRVRRLNSANFNQFSVFLRVFFRYLDGTSLLAGVRDELMARTVEGDVHGTVNRILKGEALGGSTEESAAAIGYLLLKRIADDSENADIFSLGMRYGGGFVTDYEAQVKPVGYDNVETSSRARMAFDGEAGA